MGSKQAVKGGSSDDGRIAARRKAARALRETWGEHEKAIHQWQMRMKLPPKAAGITWVYGECAHLSVVLWHSPYLSGLGAAACAATAGWWIARGAEKRKVERWTTQLWLSGMLAGVYAAVTAFVGPSLVLTSLLVLAAWQLSKGWYREHRLHVPRPRRVPAPGTELVLRAPSAVVPVDQEPDEPTEVVESNSLTLEKILTKWQAHIAPEPNGKLPGALLTLEEDLGHGWVFDVEMDGLKANYGKLEGLTRDLAGMLHVALTDVLIEQHPSLVYSMGRITFLRANPLIKPIDYWGPHYENGWVRAGRRADGGWGRVQLTDHENTCMNGLVTGGPGSGKSVFLENLGMSAKASGCWNIFYCDGAVTGDSSGLLNELALWPTKGIEGAWAQLIALEDYVMGRGLETSQMPAHIKGVNPSPERVGVLWIVDEFHRLAKDKEFAKRVENLIRVGRKQGVAVWVATQGLELGGDFANLATLRDILTQYNIVAHRTTSTYAHTMVSGLKVAPNTLPTGGGFAFLAGTGAENQVAMIRSGYAKDMTPWARDLQHAPWDEVAQVALQEHLDAHVPKEGAIQAQAEGALQAFLAKKRARIERSVLEDAPGARPEAPWGQGQGEAADDDRPWTEFIEHMDPEMRALFDSIELPPVLSAAELTLSLQPGEGAAGEDSGFQAKFDLTPVRRAILAAANMGVTRTGGFQQAVQPRFSESGVDKALKACVTAGWLKKNARGDYELTERALEWQSDFMDSDGAELQAINV